MTADNKRVCPSFLPNPKHFYLIGCCGTGMGALGVLLCEAGYIVSGSDTRFYPPMSNVLVSAGIKTVTGWEASNLDVYDPSDTIVVVGNVCRRTNPECIEAQARGFSALSLPETLYHFFLKTHKHRIVITGTHGKTTTSSLMASILTEDSKNPSVFIGGQVRAYESGAHLGAGSHFVVEGDEYDSAWFDKVPKFWHYDPTMVCINNLEFDHADIYASLEEIEQVFKKLVIDMPKDAVVVYNGDVANVCEIAALAVARKVSFGIHSDADYVARNIVLPPGGGVSLDVFKRDGSLVAHIHSPLKGIINAYNILAATVMADVLGINQAPIEKALHNYLGVKKRQELIDVVNGIYIYDDFAHHPTAVRETVRAIRAFHPKNRIWGIFEMKSNTSRRAVFQEDYPLALSECDCVVLSAPWRKDDLPPEQLINIPKIVEDLHSQNIPAHLIPNVDDIVDFLADSTRPGDIILGMSGSSFDGLHQKIEQKLLEKYKSQL